MSKRYLGKRGTISGRGKGPRPEELARALKPEASGGLPALSDRPSTAELLRVRKWECATHGHDFEVILKAGRPFQLYCCRCGESWAIQPKGDE